MTSSWIRRDVRVSLYQRDDFSCVYCGARSTDESKLTLDHVLSEEAGGSKEPSNLVTCCMSCNASKQDLPFDAWLMKLRDAKGIDPAWVLQAFADSGVVAPSSKPVAPDAPKGKSKGKLAQALAHLYEVRDMGVTKVVVAYSGGKDSLCCLWLATRVFPEVEAYLLTIPCEGIRCVEDPAVAAAEKMGVRVHKWPHPYTLDLMKNGVYRPFTVPAIRVLTHQQIQDAVRLALDVEWIVIGWKACDTLNRMMYLRKRKPVDARKKIVMPVAAWSDDDALGLVRRLGIPKPITFGRRRINSASLRPEVLLELRERHPDDYKRVIEVFPEVESQHYRWDWFKVGLHEYDRRDRRDEDDQAHEVSVRGGRAREPDAAGRRSV